MRGRKDYQELATWLVESGYVDDDPIRSGSAVALSLQTSEDAGQIYLLTCAHVLCEPPGEELEQLFGPLLPSIVVYPPEAGYGKQAARKASVVRSELDLHQPTSNQAANVADWALLKIDDPNQQSGGNFAIPGELDLSDEKLAVLGYLLGSKGVDRLNRVRPKRRKNFRVEESGAGFLAYTGGEETHQGFSGGGLFASSGHLVGIHRQSMPGQRGAIQLRHILHKLAQVVDEQLALKPTSVPQSDLDALAGRPFFDQPIFDRRNLLIAGSTLALLVSLITWVFWPPPTPRVYRVIPPVWLLSQFAGTRLGARNQFGTT